MPDPCARIAIEKLSIHELHRLLTDQLGPSTGANQWTLAGLRVTVADISQAASYAKDFLLKYGLEDSNPIWRELDSTLFPTEVEVSAPIDSMADLFRDVFADALARWISRECHCRTALSIVNGEVPFAVYAFGAPLHVFPTEYEDAFVGREWIPRPRS
jgi:hypothetical protein